MDKKYFKLFLAGFIYSLTENGCDCEILSTSARGIKLSPFKILHDDHFMKDGKSSGRWGKTHVQLFFDWGRLSINFLNENPYPELILDPDNFCWSELNFNEQKKLAWEIGGLFASHLFVSLLAVDFVWREREGLMVEDFVALFTVGSLDDRPRRENFYLLEKRGVWFHEGLIGELVPLVELPPLQGPPELLESTEKG
ncbi:MAG TPA: hypothetical protein H9867_07850 [Candidatus Corynebacterium gallistercoris]|uniref:Uncharacterized protein n=1 Tax=Candidatus Corynebacterium gallistercoris TaxID=2838530 RepID=A0A9D1URJ5_9CORY|nr:hypothetical protein [Candidatus Corynebacterium gallistercoris]